MCQKRLHQNFSVHRRTSVVMHRAVNSETLLIVNSIFILFISHSAPLHKYLSFSTHLGYYSLISFYLETFQEACFLSAAAKEVQVFLLFHCYVFNNHEIHNKSVKIIPSLGIGREKGRKFCSYYLISFMYKAMKMRYIRGAENQ